LSFVVGLVVGGVGGALLGRRRPPVAAATGSAASLRPQAPSPEVSQVAEPEPEPAPETTVIATGVEDVTAELERRYRGRRVAADDDRAR
jgi:hypothetical protein